MYLNIRAKIINYFEIFDNKDNIFVFFLKVTEHLAVPMLPKYP
jgi:hypothetical protein